MRATPWVAAALAFPQRLRHKARSASILVKLGAGAGLLALVFALAWFAFRGQSWANTWLPNFVAEWSGIAFALVVIDRLLERNRQRQIVPIQIRAERSIAINLLHIAMLVEIDLWPDRLPLQLMANAWTRFADDPSGINYGWIIPHLENPKHHAYWRRTFEDARRDLSETRAAYIAFLEPATVDLLDELLRVMNRELRYGFVSKDPRKPDDPVPDFRWFASVYSALLLSLIPRSREELWHDSRFRPREPQEVEPPRRPKTAER